MGDHRVVIKGNPYETHSPNDTKCSNGDKYRWIPRQDIEEKINGLSLDDTNEILKTMLKLQVELVSEQRYESRYNYIKKTIGGSELDTRINLNVNARVLNIRCNNSISIKLNDPTNAIIDIQNEFSLTDLPRSCAIHTLYITTSDATDIKIFAMG